jgi:hypothetical protein
MRHQPDGQFKWIFHLKDHFSKHSMLYAMKSKRASEVADNLELYIRHVGVPEILQFDNGREFKGACLILAKRSFIQVINGRPRTPRTQGLVEQANKVVKEKITKWQAENGTSTWSKALTPVCNAINHQTHESLPQGVTPARLMWLRIPNTLKYVNLYQESAIWRQLTEEVIDKIVIAGDRPDDVGNFAAEESLVNFFNQQMAAIPMEDPPISPRETAGASHSDRQRAQQDKEEYSLLVEDLIANPLDTSTTPRSTTPDSNGDELARDSSINEDQSFNPDDEELQLLETTDALLQQQHTLEHNTQLHQEGVRKRMSNKYAKGHKIAVFEVGEIATVRVPKEDRAATDNKRIPCEV